MERKHFLKSLAVLPLGAMAMNLNSFANQISTLSNSERMPAMFIGHGNPMHALNDNNFTRTLAAIGNSVTPSAILMVSAHWLTRGTFVADTPHPKTIYDFGGFPDELFKVEYKAPGSPELASELLMKLPHAKADHEWGLDHGSWTVLKHMYPKADIPVFQLSIDFTQPESYHMELANKLEYLRNKGVLIIGSGNIVHNLHQINWQNPESTYDWAMEFDAKVKDHLQAGDYQSLTSYKSWGKISKLAVPTNDHYLPMMYVLGAAKPKEELKFLFEGFEMGSISQRCFAIS